MIMCGEIIIGPIPANTTRIPSAGTMLVHRLQRWHNVVPALGQRLVLSGMSQVGGEYVVVKLVCLSRRSSSVQVTGKRNVYSSPTRRDLVLWGAYVAER